jgi:hypothetical protein
MAEQHPAQRLVRAARAARRPAQQLSRQPRRVGKLWPFIRRGHVSPSHTGNLSRMA